MWNHPERHDGTAGYITLTDSTIVEILAGLIRAAKNQSEYYASFSEGRNKEMGIVE